MNWLHKLDPSIQVKFNKQDQCKIRQKTSIASKCNESSVEQFILFLQKTTEQILNSSSLKSVMKQFPRLALLLYEVLKHNHLLRNDQLRLQFAFLFDAFLSRETEQDKTRQFVQFWCFSNFKRLILISLKFLPNDYAADYFSELTGIENVDDDLIEDMVCKFLQNLDASESVDVNFLKTLLLFTNSLDFAKSIRFEKLLRIIESCILKCNRCAQQQILKISRNSSLKLPPELIGEKIFQEISGIVNSNHLEFQEHFESVFECLNQICKSEKLYERVYVAKAIMNKISSLERIEQKYFLVVALRELLKYDSLNSFNEILFLFASNSEVLKAINLFLCVNPYSLDHNDAATYIEYLNDDFTSCAGENLSKVFLLPWIFWLLEQSQFSDETSDKSLQSFLSPESVVQHQSAIKKIISKINAVCDKDDTEDDQYLQFHLARRTIELKVANN